MKKLVKLSIFKEDITLEFHGLLEEKTGNSIVLTNAVEQELGEPWEFVTIEHPDVMYSILEITDEEDVEDWMDTIASVHSDFQSGELH